MGLIADLQKIQNQLRPMASGAGPGLAANAAAASVRRAIQDLSLYPDKFGDNNQEEKQVEPDEQPVEAAPETAEATPESTPLNPDAPPGEDIEETEIE